MTILFGWAWLTCGLAGMYVLGRKFPSDGHWLWPNAQGDEHALIGSAMAAAFGPMFLFMALVTPL